MSQWLYKDAGNRSNKKRSFHHLSEGVLTPLLDTRPQPGCDGVPDHLADRKVESANGPTGRFNSMYVFTGKCPCWFKDIVEPDGEFFEMFGRLPHWNNMTNINWAVTGGEGVDGMTIDISVVNRVDPDTDIFQVAQGVSLAEFSDGGVGVPPEDQFIPYDEPLYFKVRFSELPFDNGDGTRSFVGPCDECPCIEFQITANMMDTGLQKMIRPCGGGCKPGCRSIDPCTQAAAIVSIVEDAEGNADGVPTTAAEYNLIEGVSGALEANEEAYATAMQSASFADPENPTAAEIQAVIDAVNTP